MKLAVAVDVTQPVSAKHIVEAAVAWAVPLGATLDLVYVVGPEHAVSWIPEPTARDLLAREADQHREAISAGIDALLSQVPEAQRGVARLLEGPPVDALTGVGGDYDALLVATRGRRGLSHFWLGSISEAVVRQAPCAVLVLRTPTG